MNNPTGGLFNERQMTEDEKRYLDALKTAESMATDPANLRETKRLLNVGKPQEGGFGGVKEVKEASSKGSVQKVDLKMGKPFNADRDTRIPYVGLPNFKMGEAL
jgi:hypothetical protein